MAVESISLTESVNPADLPEGDYPGVWGGYIVRTEIQGKRYCIQSSTGVRGMNIPCTVRVKGGKVVILPKVSA